MQINILDEIIQKRLDAMDNILKIYTDGACLGNPGKGGFAWIILRGDLEYRHSESNPNTTNNRMELAAIISAISYFDEKKTSDKNYKIEIISDSQYVVNAINKGWLNSWQKNGWKKSNKESVKNQDLWEQLAAYMKKYEIFFHWVKGHDGDLYNEQCDQMANNAAVQQSPIYHELVNLKTNSNPKMPINKQIEATPKLELKLNKTSKTLTIKQEAKNPNELPNTIVINKDNIDSVYEKISLLKELLNKKV